MSEIRREIGVAHLDGDGEVDPEDPAIINMQWGEQVLVGLAAMAPSRIRRPRYRLFLSRERCCYRLAADCACSPTPGKNAADVEPLAWQSRTYSRIAGLTPTALFHPAWFGNWRRTGLLNPASLILGY